MKFLIYILIPCLLFAVDWPLKKSTDGYYLIDQSGVPFFIAGDTPWSLIANSSYAEATGYLNAMQTKGVTAILTNLIEHEFSDNAPNNYYNEPPFDTPGDFTTPNNDYFLFADSVIAMAKTRGIVVFLTPAYMGYGCGSQGWATEYSSDAELTSWGGYVGNRYKDYDNIIWVGGGDADQSACDLISEHNAMMNAIIAVDTDGLCTAHSYRTRSAKDDYNETWLDLNSTYVDASIAAESNTTYGQGLWPSFLIEGYYEGESGDMNVYLEQFYTPVLYARHIGSFLGNNPRWLCGSGWTSTYNSDATKALGYLSGLMRSRPFWKLIPDRSHTVMTANYPNEVAMTSDSTCMIAYFPTAETNSTIDMTEFSGDSVKAYWFNPETGGVTTIGTYASSGTQQLSPSADIVLVMNNTTLTSNDPGTGIYLEEAEPTPTQPNISASGNGYISGGGTGVLK